MQYIQKLQEVQTIRQLYDLREVMIADRDRHSVSVKGDEHDIQDIDYCQKVNFYIDRAEARIKDLESKGHFLDGILL